MIDNSNPLSLTAGNPNLKQEYRNMFNIRYSLAGAKRPYSLNAMLFVTQTNNAIVNSTFIAQEPTPLANGIILERGSKLTRPINVDGSWNARTFFAYGKPIAPLKLNLNLTTGFNYVRSPGLINDIPNFSNTYAVSQGLVLSSNVSEKLDFTFCTREFHRVLQGKRMLPITLTGFWKDAFGWFFGDAINAENMQIHQSRARDVVVPLLTLGMYPWFESLDHPAAADGMGNVRCRLFLCHRRLATTTD